MKISKHKLIIMVVSILCISGLYMAINFGKGVNEASAYGSVSQYATEVSLGNIIATPEKYDGKLVRVVGVGKIKFESNGLYLSKKDYEKAETKNAIWLDIDEGKLSTTYGNLEKSSGQNVLVEGVFNGEKKGHFDRYSGTIEDITRYEFWK